MWDGQEREEGKGTKDVEEGKKVEGEEPTHQNERTNERTASLDESLRCLLDWRVFRRGLEGDWTCLLH